MMMQQGGGCGDLAQQINALVAQPEVARAHWGIDVVGMDGAPIFALNEGQFFQPASNAKLFTTAAAMALLGGDSRFETKVLAEGTLSAAGRLSGELVLRGDGDGNISGRLIPYVAPAKGAPEDVVGPDALIVLARLADQVVAAGVKAIDGDVVGDDTLFAWEPYPQDWSIDDMMWGFGAPVSALSVNDNQIRVTVIPGVLPKTKSVRGAEGPTAAVVKLDPPLPYYTVEADVQTVAKKSKWGVEMERAPGSRTLRIYGTIAEGAGGDAQEIAIADPAEYAAKALKQMLEDRGVTVRGKAVARHRLPFDTQGFQEQARAPLPGLSSEGVTPACLRCNVQDDPYSGAKQLAVHRSPTVAEDVMVTNKVSQNLHAELLLHQLSVARSDDPRAGSRAQGARVVRQFLLNAGIDKDDFVFLDGSGLSGHDLVTPRATVKLLQYATTQPWYADWKRSLPVGGVDGSLQSRFAKEPLRGHVLAKTGTLGEARALSGYLECASGKTVLFSIMVDTHAPGSSADRVAMDKIVAAIAAAN